MKKLVTIFGALILMGILASCTKSGGLTGGSSGGGSGFNSISGGVSGGLSPVSGGTVNLMVAGTSTPLASATTQSNGAFTILYNNPPANSLLYVTVTGGSTGSAGTNSKSQFFSMAGTSAAAITSVQVNEMTTAAVEQVGMNMGLLTDTSGTITLNAPANLSGAGNAVTQFNNLVSSGQLNTSNSNLATAMKNGLSAMANAFASCIENASACSTLFTTAVSTTSAAATTVLESGYNALTNSSSISTAVYNLAFPLSSSTGFSLPSSTIPGGFTFNNALPANVNTYSTGLSKTQCLAIDSSGNVWTSSAADKKVVKLSSTGTILLTITIPTSATATLCGSAIDASGNLWMGNGSGGGANSSIFQISPSGAILQSINTGDKILQLALDASGSVWGIGTNNDNTVIKLNSSGTILGTFTSGTPNAQNVAIDANGNAWVTSYSGTGSVSQLSPSGTLLKNVSVSTTPVGLAIDPSGNVWVTGDIFGTAIGVEVSSSGSILKRLSSLGSGRILAIDSSGNIWIASTSGSFINSSGVTLASGLVSATGAFSIAIDPSGNVWLGGNRTNGNIFEIMGIANGPQFFPYSGPQFPGTGWTL